MQLPLHQIFLLLLIPLGIGTIASIMMARIHSANLQSEGPPAQLKESAASGAD
jgi:hypothetical protein